MDPMVSDMEKYESTQSLVKKGLEALAEGAKGKQPSVRYVIGANLMVVQAPIVLVCFLNFSVTHTSSSL